MKEDRILENIGQVEEKFIEEAAPKGLLKSEQTVPTNNTGVKYTWIKWGALAACLCIVAGLGIKMALPMFKPVNDLSPNEQNTTAGDDVLTTVDTTLLANTEAQLQVNPEEDVDTNIGTDFSADRGFPNWGLTLAAKDVSATGLTLVVIQSGGNPTGELMTGEPYRLITLVDETWKTVEELPLPEGVDARGWNSIGYPISKGETREFEINWEWIFGELPSGTYRLIKNFMDFRKTADYDTFDYWVEFEIQ